ncbi:S41 family peptidase [Robiginitalea aurantiaca]|uniref:S41 family peptidase n=1 Tax=Robiginitalea aurantiaca TaxID=3056915 RepID=A0ABT7WCB4_9FLAO|nr:S41 family peptidase [Robiginitalea aurantiaca]MDM9630560.1 S41 family peptidase [Robiginitalea aurantiaca]
MKQLRYIFIALALVACSNDDNGVGLPDNPNPDPDADVVVQDFMWQAMNLWYFWQGDVPDLADDIYPTVGEYTDFLASESDPAAFFDNKLRFADDRFSFYGDDYTELTQSLAGISRNNGMEFGLIQFDGSSNIFGYVRYILPNSDAATKDISRGELFTGVNGVTMTLDNYRDLLFGDNATYTLNMADIQGNDVVPNGKEVTLTKEDNFQEDPVYLTEVFENIGGETVGYLMYNGFTNEFDRELNDAFGFFVSRGVTELILDLRYNSGGSVNSSRLLSSMIYGTKTDQVYVEQQWNDKIQEAFTDDDPDALKDFFASAVASGVPINTLNLNRVYILTTRSTASASELVINGLDPYISVIKIGTTTRGKNEFSLTMVDDPGRPGAPFIYTPEREGDINSENSWAIQPLVGRNKNSVGFFDYTDGFAPDIELQEDLENLGVLGDPNEPLLARALQQISGISAKRFIAPSMPAEPFTHNKLFLPMKDNMVLDKKIQLPERLLQARQ